MALKFDMPPLPEPEYQSIITDSGGTVDRKDGEVIVCPSCYGREKSGSDYCHLCRNSGKLIVRPYDMY